MDMIMNQNWNEEAYLLSLGPMASYANKLLLSFAKSLDDAVKEMQLANTAHDVSPVERIAHRIKGSAGQVQCGALSLLSEELEAAANTQEFALIAPILEAWLDQAQADAEAVQDFLERN